MLHRERTGGLSGYDLDVIYIINKKLHDLKVSSIALKEAFNVIKNVQDNAIIDMLTIAEQQDENTYLDIMALYYPTSGFEVCFDFNKYTDYRTLYIDLLVLIKDITNDWSLMGLKSLIRVQKDLCKGVDIPTIRVAFSRG